MIDSKELAECLVDQMKGCMVKGVGIDGEWLYIKKPFRDDLAFWIQQFKGRTTNGHSRWSDRYQKNIWISKWNKTK